MASEENINWAIYDSLPPEEAQYQLAHIHESKVASVIVTYAVCLPILVLANIMRFVSRRIGRTKYGTDDWVMLVGLFLAILNFVPPLLSVVKYGCGRHAILMTDPVSFRICFYATDCIYPPAVGIIKISTLLLFARIFQGRNFIRILWAVGFFISTYTLIIMLLLIFQCKSIKGFWDSNLEAGCMSSTKVLVAMAVLNIITDFLVVCLPLPLLWKLQMRRGMKLQVMGIFTVGSFASVISIYRIPQLRGLSGNLYDPSWDTVAPSLWSDVELAALTLGACAITYRPLFNWVFGIKTRPVGFERPLASARIQSGPQTRVASQSNVGMDIKMQARDSIHLPVPPSIPRPRIMGTEDGFRPIQDLTEV